MGALQIMTDPPQDDVDPQDAAENALVGGAEGYGDPATGYGLDINDPSAWIPDTSSAQSALAKMRSLSESYLGGEDMGQAFDEIKQSKLNALRAARAAYQPPVDRSNLARLALGAAMMQPTISGHLSEGISNGIQAMLPWLAAQRNTEDYNRQGLAGISAQEAELPGDILSSRLTTGTDLLTKAQELEFKIRDLQQRGLWQQMSAAARLKAANIMAQARRDTANINQQGSNERRMQGLVQQAQTLAKQDAQNLIAMHYNLPADQYDKWVDDRTAHIMQSWGYKPEDYQGVFNVGQQPNPAEAELQNELSQEAVQRDPGGAIPPSAAAPGASGPHPGDFHVPTGSTATPPAVKPQTAAAPPQPAAAVATPDATIAAAENATGSGNDWSRAAAQLTPQEQKDVDTADENTNTLMMAEKGLNDALALNDKAWGGALAGAHAWVQRNLRGVVPGYHMSDEAVNTTNFQNIIDQQVLQNLKASFGSTGITEGERAFLRTVQGSVNLSPEERRPILERGKLFIAKRRQYNEWKSKAIRDGNYRNQSYAEYLKSINDPMYEQIVGKTP